MLKTPAAMLPTLLFFAAQLPAQSFYTGGSGLSDIGFGRSVAVSDGVVFVGEPETFYTPGVIHIFTPVNGDWVESGRISAERAEPADGFGFDISVDGGRLLGSALDPRRNGTGSAYLFEATSEGQWRQLAHLRGADAVEGDAFGSRVALSGDYAMVAASNQGGQAGAVYVFHRSDSNRWTQTQKLIPENGGAGEQFGEEVALLGNHVLISAPRHGGSGAVYHFSLNENGSWTENGMLSPRGVEEGDRFGAALALTAQYAAIGSPSANSGAGAVFAYRYDPQHDEWVEGGQIHPFDGALRAQFGSSLAIADDALWIGASGVDGRAGAAYVYTFNRQLGWTNGRRFGMEGLSRGEGFGSQLAAADGVAAVAASGDDYGAGSAAIFALQNDSWVPGNRVVSELEALPGVAGGEVRCENAIASSFGCEAVDLVAILPLSDMGASRGSKLNDLWGWTDSTTGHDYAIVGMHDRASFVDVTDAINPRYLGNLPMTAGATGAVWRDIKVYKGYAFIVADGAGQHGMQVFDLTRLRDVGAEPVTFTADALYDGIASAHNIAINEQTGFAYAVGARSGGETCGGGLHMINIQNPTHPTFAGCFADSETGRAGTGYTHDAQCIVYQGPDVDYRGEEICFGLNETALSIADVTDKSNPVAVSRASYPNVSYAHQGWITDDDRYFFSDDELDETSGQVEHTRTLVWDISDLDDPVLLTEYFATTNSTDHNLYVKGNRMYQSNNTAGLRVLDISDPANPVEIGHFDTFPSGEDVAGFHGNWSNFPFFDSGVILATGRREGLFILRERQELVP